MLLAVRWWVIAGQSEKRRLPVPTIEELKEQGRRSRASIVRAAAVAFARLGYAASLSDIASVLGKDKTALRYHFRTKPELALAVFEHQGAVWLAMQEDVDGEGLRGLDALCALFRRAALEAQRQPFASAVVHLSLNAFVLDFPLPRPLPEWPQSTINYLQEARSLGDLAPDSDPIDLGIALLNASLGVHQRHMHDLEQIDLLGELWRTWLPLLRGSGVKEPERLEHWFRDEQAATG